ncbi:methyl-accepting chemotaxis protein [Leeia sp. TBRC 13508]|uniref:Methyl-accepting chemotaxis protein n=1 Tax=Leeia speluncae TaxID=2884804 RepID=A0ABS8D988_9NEIS|nr:methyl-accepting chemotaxis protein [Leeia speluncae]MCB6184682.1 methyl-accepting chemotaxis protein [Leeia speluncae]
MFSLKAKLTLTVGMIAVVSLIASNFIMMTRVTEVVSTTKLDGAIKLAQVEAGKLTSQISTYLESTKTLANQMTALKQNNATIDRSILDILIKEELAKNPATLGYSNVWEANALDGNDESFKNTEGYDDSGRFVPYWYRSGQELKRVVNPDYSNPNNNLWYTTPLNSQKNTLLNPYFGPIDGKQVQMTSFMSPIVVNGKSLGVVSVDIKLTEIQDELKKVRLYDSKQLSLISNELIYIASPDDSQLGKAFKNTDAQVLSAIKNGQLYHYIDNEDFVHIYQPIVLEGAKPWTLEVVVPKSKILAGISELKIYALVISIITVLVIVFLVHLSIAKQLVPLRELGVSIHNLASDEGDLTRKIDTKSSPEINFISDGFNLFCEKIKMIVKDIDYQSGEIESIDKELKQKINEVEFRSKQQNELSKEILGSLSNLNASMDKLSSGISIVDEVIDETKEKTNSSLLTIDGIAGEVENINSIVSSLNHVMTELDSRAQKIGDIIVVIKAVAEQTNLLALNAAIEAARAGEQGRGFAVVADEVRKLAERTADATVEISQMVSSIQKDSSNATANVKNVVSIMNQTAVKTQTAKTEINAIHVVVNQLDDESKGMKDSIDAQRLVGNEMENKAGNVSNLSVENYTFVKNAVNKVEEIDGKLEDLLRNIRKFKV